MRLPLKTLMVALGVLPLVSAVACTKQLPPPGELVVAVSTDVSIPKDIDTIRMQVLSMGVTLYNESFPIYPGGPAGVKIPATLGIVAGSDPNAPVLVRVIAISKQEALVLREATVQVPTDRTALLQLPLQWLSYGSAVDSNPLDRKAPDPTVDDITEANCEANETEVAGHCESDTVKTTQLQTFEPGLVFGGGGPDGGGGKCFDTLGCFPSADSAELDMSDCTVPVPEAASASKINVAFVPGSGTGICRPDQKTKCFVPVDFVQVDNGPSDGWTMKKGGGKIQLPIGFCDKIKQKGLVATVTVSTGCESKTSQVPTCGPWSAVGTTESGSGDAGVHDATVDVGEADGGSREPEDSGRIESDSSIFDASTSTCGSGDLGGGVCNQMANVGEAVTPTCASGAPPTMTGGTIVDGTYVMTAETLYGEGCGDGGVAMAPQAETYALSGACLQAVLTSNGESETFGPDGSTTTFTDGGQLTETSAVSIQGNQLSLTALCPVGDEETTHLTFTATAETVTTVSQPSGTGGANTISVQVFTKYNGSPK